MFRSGDFIFRSENGEYVLAQILQVSEDYLIKDFWESSSLAIDELEIRSWVKRINLNSFENFEFLENRELTEKDQDELIRFLHIEEGLSNRKKRTLSMSNLVKTAIQNQQFDEALNLLTEWAMLEKYRSEIYLLREECFRKLGRNAEADYELHVYQTLTGK